MSMRLTTGLLILTGTCALAAASKHKPDAGSASSPKFDLGLPKNYAPLPSAEKVENPKEKLAQQTPSTPSTTAEFSLVRVAHGQVLLHTPEGSKPAAPLEQVSSEGDPPVTEKFSTVVRVRSTQPTNALINVVVLDPRQDILMEAAGEIFFRTQKNLEADYLVDWERTRLPRGAGTYQVLVKVAGAPVGTFPLKFAGPPLKK